MTMYWIAAVMTILFCVVSPAETLLLRNGSVVSGKLQSMDSQEIKIERCGRIEQYAREEIKSIGLESADERTCGAWSPSNVELPAGTSVKLRILDHIDSQHEPIGQVFRAQLEAAIEMEGRILVSRDSPVIVGLVQTGGTTSQLRPTLDLVGVHLGRQWARIEPLPVKGRSLISASPRIAVVARPAPSLPKIGFDETVLGGERLLVPSNTSLTFVLEQAVRLQPEGR
jgi:hypothetical protein